MNNIGCGTHFSGGTNSDSGGTIVPPFKLLKYALPKSAINSRPLSLIGPSVSMATGTKIIILRVIIDIVFESVLRRGTPLVRPRKLRHGSLKGHCIEALERH